MEMIASTSTSSPTHDPLQPGMISGTRRAAWLALLIAGPVLLLLLKLVPSLDITLLHNNILHTVVVSGATLLGMLLALLTLHVARRAGDARVFLVGLGFLITASIFFVHAIATPNVLMEHRTAAASWSTQLSLVAGSVFFALSGMALSSATNQWIMRYARAWLLLLIAGWLAYCFVFLVVLPANTDSAVAPAAGMQHDADAEADEYGPNAASSTPSAQSSITGTAERDAGLKLALTLFGLACYSFAGWRHGRLYCRTPSPTAWAILCGITFFGESLLTQAFWTPYSISFWLSHTQELLGFGIIAFAVLGAYRRGQTNESLLESLFLAGTRAELQAKYSAAMDELVRMLAHGEQPSLAQRSAMYELDMSAAQLQVFERTAQAVAHERQQRQELEHLNATLRQVEQAKTQLTNMVVHDMKTPLTGLIGYLELMRMREMPSELRPLLDTAIRSGRNLSGLIGDLLDIARVEEGRLELERSWFAPADLLHDCVRELSAWLEQTDQTAIVEVAQDCPPSYADYRLLQRVFFNLLSNAIKHTPSGTTIILRAWNDTEQTLVFEVEDDGPGISPDDFERIFEPFMRSRGTSSVQQTNTGLGLTFCKLAVEAHGGTIVVASTPGAGTTFRVSLPITQHAEFAAKLV